MKVLDIFACSLDGIQLIDASAGTGKTYTITGLVLRLLLERNLPIEQILVVTFTEAATEELREKTRKRIRSALAAFEAEKEPEDEFFQRLRTHFPDADLARERLEDALRNFDQAAIYTIHGFCQRMLTENSLETGCLFDTELITDDSELRREIGEDFWRGRFYKASSLFVDYGAKKFRQVMPILLTGQLTQPRTVILPEVTAELECQGRQELEERFVALIKALRCSWLADQEEVGRVLLEDKALRRNKYRRDWVEGWLAILDEWLGLEFCGVELFDKFDRFTTENIQAATKDGQCPPEHRFFQLCSDLFIVRNSLVERYDRCLVGLKVELVRTLRAELSKRKEARNVHAFDDLLTRLHQGISGGQGAELAQMIRRKFPAALIDEFQDTDPVQYEIFSSVYRDTSSLLFLIGDPKQAIYSFRGADIFAYMRATREVGERHTLGVNYRATAGLVRAVNTVFGCSRLSPFVFDAIPFSAVEAAKEHDPGLILDGAPAKPFRLCWVAGEDEKKLLAKERARELVLQQTGQEIAWLLVEGSRGRARLVDGAEQLDHPVRPGDIAVLVRANREARMMQEVLAALGVDSVVMSSENIFSSCEAEEMARLLAALAEPGNSGKVKAALVSDLLGVDGAGLEDLLNKDEAWVAWLERFREYHRLWLEHGFIRMFRHLVRREGVRGRLLSFAAGERRLTNVLHLAELLHRAEMEKRLGMAGLMKFLARQRAAGDDGQEDYQLRLESDAERVRIVTIHKSKGLQYPIVFCPFCWEGSRLARAKLLTFHRPEAGGEMVVDLDPQTSGNNMALARQEELAENVRLLYVALTRAQYSCYLFWGPFSGAEGSALAYLLHQPPGTAAGNLDIGTVMAEVAARFKASAENVLFADLQALVDSSQGTIVCDPLSDRPGITAPLQAGSAEPLVLPEFSGVVERQWRIASFSSLIRSRTTSVELPDRDSARPAALGGAPEETMERAIAERSIFGFPQGARPGNFCHDLLEHLDYQRVDRAGLELFVGEKLNEYGFDPEWRPTVCNMLDNVLTTVLDPADSGLVLEKLGPDSRLHELEFYIPLTAGATEGIAELVQRLNLPPLGQVPVSGLKLSGPAGGGFLKGFIDLVFQWQDRFYLLDWKSNFLGDRVEHYHHSRLREVMRDDFYLLQYHLYTLALDSYLRLRLPNYSYAEHFGGVFYLFLRGMDPAKGPEFGVFRDRPAEELISETATRIIG